MKLRLRENLFFELKIQFKKSFNLCSKIAPVSPGDRDGGQHFRDGGPGDGGYIFFGMDGDPGTGIFYLTRGLRTLFMNFLLNFNN